MTLDAVLLEHVRLGSAEMWRGVRKRVGTRVLLLLLLVHAAFSGLLWLTAQAGFAGRGHELAVGVGRILLPVLAVCAGCGVAVVDSLSALIVSGPLLRTLGDLVLGARLHAAVPDLAGQFASLASSTGLARHARMRDLPLILFLTRSILQVDAALVLQAARNGIGREGLVREVERRTRDAATRTLQRLRSAVWVVTGLAIWLPLALGWVHG